MNLYRFETDWLLLEALIPPAGVSFTALAAANKAGRLEVIAAGSDHQLYYSHSTAQTADSSTFVEWSEVDGAVTSGEPNSLALLTTGSALHAFWLTDGGNVGHAWGPDADEAVGFEGHESGDDASAVYLRPLVRPSNLNATSPSKGRMDIVLGGVESFLIQHLWFDGDWGNESSPHHEELHCLKVDPNPRPFDPNPRGFAVLSANAGEFDVFVSEGPNRGPTAFYHATYSIESGWSGWDEAVVFQSFDVHFNAAATIVDGLVWTGARRKDLFGLVGNSDSLWRAYYH